MCIEDVELSAVPLTPSGAFSIFARGLPRPRAFPFLKPNLQPNLKRTFANLVCEDGRLSQVLPRRHQERLADLNPAERASSSLQNQRSPLTLRTFAPSYPFAHGIA